MNNRINNNDYFEKHDAYGNRELKFYKDIYGNDVRLLTSKEKKVVNKSLIISSLFLVILLSGFFYKAYLIKQENIDRTNLYLMSGETIVEGQDIVEAGGVIVSDNSDIVKVEHDGTIVAKNGGTTSITLYKNIDKSSFLRSDSGDKKDKTLYDIYNNLGIDGEVTFNVTVQNKVTGVSVFAPVINMNVGEINKISTYVFPRSVSVQDKDVKWSTSNSNVAVVDSKGVVTARGVGKATITVTTKDGMFKDSTLINVVKKESKNNIYLALKSNDLYVNDTTDLITVVSPDEKLVSKVVYSSSNPSVASVNAKGNVVAKKAGKVSITARIPSEDIIASIDIIVKENKIENIYLSSKDLVLKVSDFYDLKVYFTPSDVSGGFTYTSSDSSIVSVDFNGKIKALKEGVATIDVKSNNGILAKCIVTVKNDVVKADKIEALINKTSIDIGEKTFINANVFPVDAFNKNVTFVSSDQSVAEVYSDGTVIGKSSGNVIITVTNSSGISENLSLKVKDTKISVEKIELDSNMVLTAGTSKIIGFSIEPINANNGEVVWSSSDSSIVKVNKFGVVTGVKGGSAVITANVGNVKSSLIVNVLDVKATKVILNYDELKMFIGDNFDIKANVYPVNVTNSDVLWISSNQEIAKVNENGKISAVKEGKVVVKAISKSDNKVFAECVVNVSKVEVEAFDLSHEQVVVTVGEEVVLKAKDIRPSNASYPDAEFIINDNSIAAVENGVVKGINPGKTTISVNVDGLIKIIDLTVLDSGNKVYFINTNKYKNHPSDAILLESNGKYAMIDTGSNVTASDTIKFLKELGIKRLEFILITHFHGTSFGGIYGRNANNNILLSDIQVGKVYMKPYSARDSYFLDVNGTLLVDRKDIINRRDIRSEMFLKIKESVVSNDISYYSLKSKKNHLEFGDFDLNLYNLEDQFKNYNSKCLDKHNCDEDSNSIVVYAKVNGKGLYFASDIYNAYNDKSSSFLGKKTEEEVAKEIVEAHDEKIDVYKASNYGYSKSNVSGALNKIRPKYSIITNERDNLILDKAGVERIEKYTLNDVYYTGDGTIVVNINKEGNISFVQLNN